jgi:prephenate dehydratase
MTIAIQGNKGSYHEEAAKKIKNNAAHMHCEFFSDVFSAVKNGQADYGVVAIANNRYGFIPEVFEFIMNDKGATVQIIGDVTLPIKHQLLAKPGTKIVDVTQVHSQVPALGQCGKFVRRNLPKATIVEHTDTAKAAEYVALSDEPIAAIASHEAGQLHGLNVVREDVQDDPLNLTRFLFIEKSSTARISKDSTKTSIVLTTTQEPGSLAAALAAFSEHGINIDLIHSSFVANTNFTMNFLLEYDYGWQAKKNLKLQQQLELLKCKTHLLGSYSPTV